MPEVIASSSTVHKPEIVKIGELNGLPLYQGTSVKSIDQLLDQGEDLFYILGYESVEQVVNSVTKKSSRPAIYIVRKNLVSYTIRPVSDTDIKVNQALENTATLLLPQIPWQLERKMSEFFHKAYKLHGTEAILLLTYDENYLNTANPGDGWGCIAPKQTNTSMDCHYEIDEEVHAQKLESEYIVGSVHSHPNMNAYFSGTDHKDQADFDGLHITYGWKGQGPDEYYIELVMFGAQYTYDPKVIFAQPPTPELEDTEEVDKWIESVSKKATVVGGSTTTNTSYMGTTTKFHTPAGASALDSLVRKNRALKIPTGCPTPDLNTLIGGVPEEALTNNFEGVPRCVLCDIPLVDTAIESMRCYGCGSFISLDFEDIDQFTARYIEKHKELPEAIDPNKATKPIIFVWKQGDGTVTFGTDVRSAEAKKS